jgi:hypothetical protein
MVSYSILLEIAERETANFVKQLTDLRNQDWELSRLRNRIDIYNPKAFELQRSELKNRIKSMDEELRRSQGREELLRQYIAEGKIRALEVVAA